MHSLVLYRIEKLPGKGVVASNDRHPRGTRERDTPPVSSRIDLTDKIVARHEYCEAGLTHLEPAILNVLWQDQVINECVLVHREKAYYSRKRGYFIFDGPTRVARSAVARLHTDCANDFHLVPVPIDFDALLDQKPKDELHVLGAWTRRGQQNTPIRSRAAFAAEDIRTQAAFKDMRANGDVSILSVRVNFKNDELRVSLSRYGSALMYGDVDLETRIEFMEHLAGFAVKEKPPAAAKRAKKKKVK